ncbi:MAG: hypothetical protein FWH36_07045 [Lentimicrobiaceae bacterium]|nr:hypothetical protein [Lentimicrobiaceae bacterium]
MSKTTEFLGKRNGTDKLSWYRMKCLLSMHPKGNGNVSKWILYPILMMVLLGAATFFVWLDPSKEILGNMIWMMYMMTSYALLSFLNTDKSQEIHYLLLPASAKEKIIAHIIQAIGTPTAMLALIVSAIIFIQGMVNIKAGQTMTSYMPIFEVLTVGNLLAGLFSQALFCFSILAFRKWAMIKGMLVGFLVLCVIILVKALVTELEIAWIEKILTFVLNGILLLSTVFIWIANYYKLKKREI